MDNHEIARDWLIAIGSLVYVAASGWVAWNLDQTTTFYAGARVHRTLGVITYRGADYPLTPTVEVVEGWRAIVVIGDRWSFTLRPRSEKRARQFAQLIRDTAAAMPTPLLVETPSDVSATPPLTAPAPATP